MEKLFKAQLRYELRTRVVDKMEAGIHPENATNIEDAIIVGIELREIQELRDEIEQERSKVFNLLDNDRPDKSTD